MILITPHICDQWAKLFLLNVHKYTSRVILRRKEDSVRKNHKDGLSIIYVNGTREFTAARGECGAYMIGGMDNPLGTKVTSFYVGSNAAANRNNISGRVRRFCSAYSDTLHNMSKHPAGTKTRKLFGETYKDTLFVVVFPWSYIEKVIDVDVPRSWKMKKAEEILCNIYKPIFTSKDRIQMSIRHKPKIIRTEQPSVFEVLHG